MIPCILVALSTRTHVRTHTLIPSLPFIFGLWWLSWGKEIFPQQNTYSQNHRISIGSHGNFLLFCATENSIYIHYLLWILYFLKVIENKRRILHSIRGIFVSNWMLESCSSYPKMNNLLIEFRDNFFHSITILSLNSQKVCESITTSLDLLKK